MIETPAIARVTSCSTAMRRLRKVASHECRAQCAALRGGVGEPRGGLGKRRVGARAAGPVQRLHRDILGCRERDRPADPPFDHNTGRGHVAFHKGDYYDAIYNKNNHVVPLIVEVFGGIASKGAQ